MRNAGCGPYESAIIDANSGPGRQPTVRWNAKQAAAADHLTARFRHRRRTKLQTAGECPAVPGRLGPAVVFLPARHPWKIGAAPNVSEGYLDTWRINHEVRVFTILVEQMRRDTPGNGGVRKDAQIADCAIGERAVGPVKLGAGFHSTVAAQEVDFVCFRAGGRH